MTNIKVLESAINLAHSRKHVVVIENKVYTIHDLVDILVKDLKRLEKLEQAIEILKDKLEIELHYDSEYFKTTMINGSEIYKNLTLEQYELLKEVLR